jgi:hypothetical protein
MKEKEILKMLKYLSKNPYKTNIRERTENSFYVSFNIFNCRDKEIVSRDHCSTEIDFNKKDINLFACDESYHNGSDYNNIKINYKWANIDIIYNALASLTKDFLLKEEQEKSRIEQENIQAVIAESRLQRLLNE